MAGRAHNDGFLIALLLLLLLAVLATGDRERQVTLGFIVLCTVQPLLAMSEVRP